MDQTKRELLNRMGIDVWQKRQHPASNTVQTAPSLPKESPKKTQPLAGVKSTPVVEITNKKSEAAGKNEAEQWHFEVLYIVSGGAIMIIDREDYRGVNRRLADDMLRMLGEPNSKPQAVSFRWPQLNTGTRESGLSAWGAFIEKKLESQKTGRPLLFVVDSELCQQLSEAIPLKFEWLPKLDQLLGNGQAKRELWQALKPQN